MKVLELFAGTRSIGKAFERRGHEVFSVEWSKDFEDIDLYEDISKVTPGDILKLFGKPDVIWASPDCSTFSIAAISHHRRKNPDTGSKMVMIASGFGDGFYNSYYGYDAENEICEIIVPMVNPDIFGC